MTAKEKLLERAPGWSEEQAEAALRVVEAQIELTEEMCRALATASGC